HTDAGRRAEVGAQDLGHHARLLLVPVALALAARPVAVVAARHHVADARLLVAVVVVVGDEHGAEAVHAGLGLVAGVVRDQLQLAAVQLAAPDGAGLAVGVVAAPDLLAALAAQAADALVADAEIELVVRADQDAVNAVVVVDAAEAGQQFPGRAVGLAVA